MGLDFNQVVLITEKGFWICDIVHRNGMIGLREIEDPKESCDQLDRFAENFEKNRKTISNPLSSDWAWKECKLINHMRRFYFMTSNGFAMDSDYSSDHNST